MFIAFFLLSDYHVALRENLPTFKTILTHPFLTGEKSPNRPKALTEALKLIAPKPKPKTPPKAKTKTPSPKLSTTERKKKMNNAIKKAVAVLAKPKPKPPMRRPGVARPNPVPEIQPASPELGPTARAIKKLMEKQAVNVEAIRLKMGLPRKIGGEPLPQNLMTPSARKKFNEKVKKKMVENNEAPYGVMSPSNMMEYARKIESGRKKAANKLNAKLKEIKATKGKTPTPVRLKEKFSFVNVKGKKREFVRKFAYDRALAKNKAFRELKDYDAEMQAKINQIENPKKFSFVNIKGKKREFVRKFAYDRALAKNKAELGALLNILRPTKVGSDRKSTPKAKTPTPKAKWSNANNKQFMELLAREKNAQRKLANKMNKAQPLKNGPLDPAVAYALNTPKPSTPKKAVNRYINKFVNKLDKDEVNALKKKICKP